MPRKASKRTLRNKADSLWSKVIRLRGRCEWCSNKNHLQAAHIESRRYLSIRYDLDNGLCLCAGCHLKAHHSPTKFTYWLEDYKGREYLEELHKRNKPTYGKFDWESTVENLEEQLYDELT